MVRDVEHGKSEVALNNMTTVEYRNMKQIA